MKKGMSLIVLVITILVMIILAGVVVVGLSDNNPIDSANSAKALTELGNFAQSANLYASNKLAHAYNPDGTARDTRLVGEKGATSTLEAELDFTKTMYTISDDGSRKVTAETGALAKTTDAKYFFQITDNGYKQMAITKTVLNNAMYVINCNGNLKLLVNTNDDGSAAASATYSADIIANGNVITF